MTRGGTGALGFIEITSNESFWGADDLWDRRGSAANVAAAISNVSLPVLFTFDCNRYTSRFRHSQNGMGEEI